MSNPTRTLAGYHSPQVEVDVRLNTNESPYPPPADYVRRLADAVAGIDWHRYPDRRATRLREAIATRHGVEPAQIFCANGSNEVIQCLLMALAGPQRHVSLFDPTYQLHTHIAHITSTPVRAFGRATDFHLDPREVAAAIGGEPAVLFLCSPNNPTGTVDDPAAAESLTMGQSLLLVDEAYGEFSPTSMIGAAARSASVAVLRTFSKVWSLAALRLGYLVGPAALVDEIESVALPYHLSAFTQTAGLLALDYPDEMEERVQALTVGRDLLHAELTARPEIEVWPSGANFLLFRPLDGDGGALWRRLLDHSVLVRDFSTRHGIEGCLRVTVGTPIENARFLEAVDASL